MRLRTKTLLVVGATLLGLTLVLELAARTLIMPGFDAIEADAVLENVERARQALADELTSLADTAHDYAAWDETYRFVQTRSPEYLARQLLDERQPELRVTVIALLDLEGRVLHERLLDFAGRRQLPLPPSLARSFEDPRLLYRNPATRRGRSGVLVVPEGEWVVASWPILDNSQTAPARGTLVMARPLDAELVRALARRTRLALELRRFEGPAPPHGLQPGDHGPLLRTISDEEIDGHVLLNDIHGAPALALTVHMPRPIHLRARKAKTYFTASLLLMGLLFGGAMIGLIETVVLARLKRDALHDPLTGLPNRTLLMDRLRQALARTRRHTEEMCAVLFLDLDRFKVVNDSLGHELGDQLLCEVGRRIERSVRPEDTVARLGGDEFIVLLERVRGSTDAIHAAERIQAGIAHAFSLGDTEFSTTASIGIALGGRDHRKPEDLIRDADTAMYRAKAAGKARHQLFDNRMHTQAMTVLRLENDLRRAVERSEFEVHYQPIVQLAPPGVVGFEALVRWRQASGALVLPGEFIPLAEETGLIVPIGRWVLERACADARSWQRDIPRDPPLTLSVNLSARQLVEADLLRGVEEILKRTEFDARSLELEITESVIMQRPDVITVVLGRLKDLGIRVSIDDFGTGYSSLSYLHLFPVDRLKIDRSFVNSMQVLGKQRRIVETILMLARNLGIDVVAEGVEGEEQRQALHALGCGLAQGYLFSRPVDEASVRRLLAADRPGTRPALAPGPPA